MIQYHANNTVSGRHCDITAKIDGVVHNLGMCKTFESSIEKSDTEVNTLQCNWTQHRGGPLSGSLDMTMYFGVPIFHDMMEEYAREGIEKYFEITVSNNDPGSQSGAQTITYQHCTLISCQPSKADVDAEVLEEDMQFTFAGIQTTGRFNDSTV